MRLRYSSAPLLSGFAKAAHAWFFPMPPEALAGAPTSASGHARKLPSWLPLALVLHALAAAVLSISQPDGNTRQVRPADLLHDERLAVPA